MEDELKYPWTICGIIATVINILVMVLYKLNGDNQTIFNVWVIVLIGTAYISCMAGWELICAKKSIFEELNK